MLTTWKIERTAAARRPPNAYSALPSDRSRRERRRKELLLAAEPKRVEELSRQQVQHPQITDTEIVAGRDPWVDFELYRKRGYQLYCYQALEPLQVLELREIAFGKRVDLAVWYDLRNQEASIIVQVSDIKLMHIPAETTHLAAFWVAPPT